MNKTSVKKNFFYQSLYEILIIVLPLITSPYIARVLGAEKLGIYSYTYTIANYFVLFAGLGVKNYGNRTIAIVRDDQNKLNRTFSSIYAVMVIIAIIVSIIYIGYIVFLCKYKIIASIQFLYVLSCILDINWFYFGIEKFKITVARNTIIKIGTIISIFIFVKEKEDLWLYCLIMASGVFISQAVVWFFLKNYVKIEKPTIKEMRVHVKPLFILFIPVLAISLYKYMDKIILGLLSTKSQVSFFDNAEKAINIPTSIITAFGTIMLPRMSNMAKNGDLEMIKDYIQKSSELVMCIACALTFGLMGVARNFAIIFWGIEFAPCGVLIIALSMTIPFLSFANVIRTQFLIPQKMDMPYITSVFVGAGVNLVLNLILIPKYNALGAAISTIAAEMSVCILQMFFVRKKLPILTYVRDSLIFVFFGMTMYMIVNLLDNAYSSLLSLLLQIFVGSIFYTGCCLVYFKITNNKIILDMIYSIFQRIKRVK